jgi:hypothetical protein
VICERKASMGDSGGKVGKTIVIIAVRPFATTGTAAQIVQSPNWSITPSILLIRHLLNCHKSHRTLISRSWIRNRFDQHFCVLGPSFDSALERRRMPVHNNQSDKLDDAPEDSSVDPPYDAREDAQNQRRNVLS